MLGTAQPLQTSVELGVVVCAGKRTRASPLASEPMAGVSVQVVPPVNDLDAALPGAMETGHALPAAQCVHTRGSLDNGRCIGVGH